MYNIKILEPNDYPLYVEHVNANYKNSRMDDPELMNKITDGLSKDNKIIFAVFDEGKIKASIYTSKRISVTEYIVVNYRTSSTAFFSKKMFLALWSAVFDYYESIGYFKWLSIRKIDLFSDRFKGLGHLEPFHKYETAIEYAPKIYTNNEFFYNSMLFNGIPESADIKDYILISGFCKQEYRKMFDNLNFI